MRIPLSRLRVVGTGLLFAIAAVASCVAQRLSSDQVRLGSITPVSPAGSGIHLMMFRATSEADRNVLMVCGTRLTTRTNGAEGFVYVSHDEGKTWKETMVEHSTEWSSEQSCTTDGNGRAYFAGGDSN